MHKVSKKEFSQFLINFQSLAIGHLLSEAKGLAVLESITLSISILAKGIEDKLLDIDIEETDLLDDELWQELYAHYLRRFSEKKYLEIDQYKESKNDLDA